jgi:hypothetical protein
VSWSVALCLRRGLAGRPSVVQGAPAAAGALEALDVAAVRAVYRAGALEVQAAPVGRPPSAPLGVPGS